MSKSKQKRREQVGGPMNNPQNMAASMSPLPGCTAGSGQHPEQPRQRHAGQPAAALLDERL